LRAIQASNGVIVVVEPAFTMKPPTTGSQAEAVPLGCPAIEPSAFGRRGAVARWVPSPVQGR
jgi:hypothetical protein